ncbi:MAG: tetratricopeptide repeat protein, partial [Planctomycetales bacterium]|nr:tetratricopeptide repeat protein [Planctomycetales bacterium]
MQQSLFRVVCSQLLIVTLSVLPFSARFAGAQEQVRIPTSSLPGDVEDASAIESVLSQGRVLEKEQRWPEALSHYDAALKKYPQHTDLQRRQTLAEIHCELDRRFADSSFANLVRTTDERRALEAFDEVVLKIQTHYVVEPDWQKLTWRGTANLDVALTKPTFVKINAPQASSDQINAFRHE